MSIKPWILTIMSAQIRQNKHLLFSVGLRCFLFSPQGVSQITSVQDNASTGLAYEQIEEEDKVLGKDLERLIETQEAGDTGPPFSPQYDPLSPTWEEFQGLPPTQNANETTTVIHSDEMAINCS